MSLLYDTGARVSELIGIKIKDIRFDNSSTVTLYGKGKKIRTAITPIVTQSGREKLVAELSKKIIDAQSSKVDAISGATVSSNAFFKSVEDALTHASK